jgi:hypothetical protein
VRREALWLLLLASGCDRCRGEHPPVNARPPYDARPPPNPDAPPTWSTAGKLVAPDVLRARGFPLPFGRALSWKKEPEISDTHDGRWKKTAARPPCADVPGGFEELARIPDEIVFAVGATCGYDAERDTWVPVPKFDVQGSGWAITQLDDGHLLVTGGGDAKAPRKDAFRWDSDTKKVETLTLLEPRHGHAALRLLDDTVLITSPTAGVRMELFVPSTKSFRALGAQEFGGQAVLLEDGRVLFLAQDTCGLYDPSSGGWQRCPPMSTPRVAGTFTITSIPEDRALVTGGRAVSDPSKPIDLVEIYDPHDDVWIDVLSMPVARADHVAIPLLDGRVVIVDGVGKAGPVADVFFYTPELPPLPPPLVPLPDADTE